MKRIVALIVLFFAAGHVIGQSYWNEWIDLNKTYYKFKVGATGLYRINATDLAAIGLENTIAESFQLWRNGKQVPLYTSAAGSALGAGGYIEFWGEKNDGVPDNIFYRITGTQLSDKESLLTDTAAFFLTVNPGGNNLRFLTTPNNVSGNTLPAEPYFMYALRQNFREQINPGWAEVVGEYVYSSSYDVGEMWSTNEIYAGSPRTFHLNNLSVAAGGPAATAKISVAGAAGNYRNYTVGLNGNAGIINQALSTFDARVDSASVPLSLLTGDTATFTFSNKSTNTNDRIVAGFMELKYPRLFNFNNQSNFAFTVAGSDNSRYFQISNFNSQGTIPVLYDLTNLRRYVADVSTPGAVKFVVLPSAGNTDFVLVAESNSNVKVISSFLKRNFTDFKVSANQGDFIIITHTAMQVLYNGKNQVNEYVAYRSSAAGGSFVAKVYDVDQLTDQFGYGIKKNPIAIKNFLRFARNTFPFKNQYAFLIGKGMTYAEYRANENNPLADKLDLVPTFGFPASDVLLASNSMDPVMNTLTSRLSVLYPEELALYLDKVKQYEQAQQSTSQTIESKAWMKNMVHVVGGGDAGLDQRLSAFMRGYQVLIEDTLFGAHVTNFNKLTTGPVTPITNSLMAQLFEQGISFISYFGHSSASSFDYNLDDPSAYNNTGKYPMFCANGCNAGNLFSFDTTRLTSVNNTLSEKYVLAKAKGTIGFIASTHFGIDTYLDTYNRGLYKSIGITGYGKSITYNMGEAIIGMLATYGSTNRLARLHAEESTLHGDPAIKMNSFDKPDYVVEEPQIKVSPNIVSIADNKFSVTAYVYNIGKAVSDSVVIQVKHRYPNGTDSMLFNKRVRSIRYKDSVAVEVPIVASRDKGENKIIVSIDPDSRYDELSESNNTATVTFPILSDELKTIYPYDFAIVNRPNAKVVASTAEPAGVSRQYAMEMDTTALFNSSFKISRNAASAGGIIEFDPGITYTDSTTYYWRVAPVPSSGAYLWNNASFVYLSGANNGFNQSHFYQHTKSDTKQINVDTTTRKWVFGTNPNQLTVVNSVFGVSGNEDTHFSVQVNGGIVAASACLGHSVIFNVFNPVTLQPLYNQAIPSETPSGTYGGFMNSAANCQTKREINFEFSYLDTAGRRKMKDFMDWIPAGSFVTVRLILDAPFDQTPLVDTWKNDAIIYGNGNTLYDHLKTAGFADLDTYTYPRTWAFIYRKNSTAFTPVSLFSNGLADRITLNTAIDLPDTDGTITSPQFGPATSWKEVVWRGGSSETTPGDVAIVNVLGITPDGHTDTLYRLNTGQQNFSLSSVSAAQYPYIRLSMRNQDAANFTPYQLRYWRVYYDPIPEGALAANLTYRFRDTLELGEKLDFAMAFKNVSDFAFSDSLVTNLTIYDKNNVATVLPIPKNKKLQPGDTALIASTLDTKLFAGNNTLFLDVNPNFQQPEQYRFNNFMYKNFFVKADTYNPLMDVTFDGVHILNGDIVSAKPKIVIRLKDDAKFLALDDTSLVTVFVRYPDANGTTVRYAFGSDTLRFIPADLSTGKNEATIEFSPAFLQDSEGDFYELIVKAKDKSGNSAGNVEYRVKFQVYNKPMISNMFNYPNPFTTSTAFVFTITGSDVPQNIRIQIMTVTGKIVREITKQELGPLHIGRNITEFKWDGTDQYGSKLANGIYLYHVMTNLNGASLGKFNTVDATGDKVDTDKYFNKGYGKMYLMR